MTRLEGYATYWRNELQVIYTTREQAEKEKGFNERVQPQVFWATPEQAERFLRTGKL